MKNLAPYQIFFPIGVLCAFFAIGVWFVQDLAWFSTPVILIHSRLVMGGFLWSFVTGFLMTAVPKMSGTRSANLFEYLAALIIILVQISGSFMIDGRLFYAAAMALSLFIIFYAGRRVATSSKKIPVFFSHVGVGLLLSLIGSYQGFIGDSSPRMHLYNVGAVLLLVLGIGTRFFSFLSGLPSLFENQSKTFARFGFHLLAMIVGVLLWLAGEGFSFAYLGLSLAMLIYLFFVWQIQRSSQRSSALKIAVRLVASIIPLSFFLCWLYPILFLTWFHLIFIGCFAMMTFSVASRVTLAHGSYPIDLETTSRSLWFVVGFIFLALISRIGYGLTEGMTKKSFLHMAAMFWLLAIIVWCWSFLIKIWKPGKAKSAC